MSPTHPNPDHPLIQKVLRRLIPFCVICYILNYIDRVNISIAALKMKPDIGKIHTVEGFTDAVIAQGLAIFFLGYTLFEVPSNLIQQRVGPRWWISRIMISWGIISMCFVFISGPISFYLLRFLLGLAEAGFFPGIILYLSLWVPHAYRARASALFLTSTAIAGIIGNPLGGAILYFAEKHPLWLTSWQWLFIIEGLPTVILGVIAFYFLTDTIPEARWLTPDERSRLQTIMADEHLNHPAHHASDFRHALTSPHTWLLSLLYALVIFGFYNVNFFTPFFIKDALARAGTLVLTATPEHAATPEHIVYLLTGALSAIPFGVATIGMILIARHSDKHNERTKHFAFACCLITLGLASAGFASLFAHGLTGTILVISGLSIAAIGTFGMFGPFWAMPPQLLTGAAAAGAFAIINSIGNLLGGYCGPTLAAYASREIAIFVGAALALIAAVIALVTDPGKSRRAPQGFPVISNATPEPNPIGPSH